jgi:MFS transporter, SP family, general alpha glucoside:H+ symporter
LVGQLFGLALNTWAQDRFGTRKTYMIFMAWLCAAIFIPVFAPNISVLAFGEAMCGISWGVFQVSQEAKHNSKLTNADPHHRLRL